MALSIQQPSLLAPHKALTLLCPHILDELTLATLTLPCHTNEVSAAENWVAEGVMNGPLSLPCLLSPVDSRVALMFRKSWNVSLWGRGVFGNRGEPPKLVPSRGNLPPRPNLIHSVQGGPCGFAHRGDCLIVSPLCSTTEQRSCAEVEKSRIMLAILHQTVSCLDGIVLTVVFTNVMRKLLI